MVAALSAQEQAIESGKKAVDGRVYALKDFTSLSAEMLARLRAIIDEAFGRGSEP